MSSKRLEIVLSADATAAVTGCRQATSAVEALGRAAAGAQQSLAGVGAAAASGSVVTALAAAGLRSDIARVGDQTLAAGAKAEQAGDKWRTFAARGKSAMATLGVEISTMTSRMMNSMGLTIARYLAVAGAAVATAAGVKAVIKLGAELQQTRLTLQTMLGDVAKGNAVLKQFTAFANATPFDNREVVAAGKTLLAYGVAVGEVLAALKAVGDVAAGTGKNLEELAAVYGKIIAKGKADTMALNQLSGTGVPIVRALARQYGITAQAVYAYAEQGRIAAADVQKAFREMSSGAGAYANMMAKQAETASGKWSTLIGKLQNTAAVVGEALMPMVEYLLDRLTSVADLIGEMAESGELTEYLFEACAIGIDGFESLLVGATGFFGYVDGTVMTLYHTITALLGGLLDLITRGLKWALIDPIEDVIDSVLSMYNWVMDKLGGDKVYFERGSWGAFAGYVADDLGQQTIRSAQEAVDDAKSMAGVEQRQMAMQQRFAPIKSELHNVVEHMRAAALERRNAPDMVDGRAVIIAGEDAVPATVNTDSGGNAGDKIQVDSLAKIGLYNHTGEQLDEERNKTLKSILTAVLGLTSTPQIVEA